MRRKETEYGHIWLCSKWQGRLRAKPKVGGSNPTERVAS
jgi:hypothetical protein